MPSAMSEMKMRTAFMAKKQKSFLLLQQMPQIQIDGRAHVICQDKSSNLFKLNILFKSVHQQIKKIFIVAVAFVYSNGRAPKRTALLLRNVVGLLTGLRAHHIEIDTILIACLRGMCFSLFVSLLFSYCWLTTGWLRKMAKDDKCTYLIAVINFYSCIIFISLFFSDTNRNIFL